MNDDRLMPTQGEVEKWMLFTLRHSVHVEYYLQAQMIYYPYDSERPHDIAGPGNKFEPDVVFGMALQYREPKVDFGSYIEPAIEKHRQQRHHKIWNDAKPGAGSYDMIVGATDAICSLREPRDYQGGVRSFDEIMDMAMEQDNIQGKWMALIIPGIKAVNQPNLEAIDSLHGFPNFGFYTETISRIRNRVQGAIWVLQSHGYFQE